MTADTPAPAFRPDQIQNWLALRAAGTPETIETLYQEWPLMPAPVYLSRYEKVAAEPFCITNGQWAQRYWTLYRRALATDAAAAAL